MRADVRHRIDRDGDDLVRRVVRDLLDVHAAFGRGDDRDARDFAVDQHREIELLLDRGALLDVDAVDLLALRAGLQRDESRTEHLPGELLYFVDRLGDAHAALVAGLRFLEFALAAAAGVDLRLDGPHRAAELLCRLHGLRHREGRKALRNRHAEFRENRFALVLVDVHAASLEALLVGWAKARSAEPTALKTGRARFSLLTREKLSPPYGSYFPSCGAILLQASISVRTAVTDLSNISRSAPVNSSSITRSTPFEPITTGTPTYMSFTPYSPLR